MRPPTARPTSPMPTGSCARRRLAAPASSCSRRSGRCLAAASSCAPATSWAREIARELSLELLAGSFTELTAEKRRQNTSLHIGPDGEIRATYRKIHMFDVTVEGLEYRESEHEDPGDEIVVSRTAEGLELGMTVCYDLRFPELYRILALRGARVLLVPAAFTLATTREHWEVLLRARGRERERR